MSRTCDALGAAPSNLNELYFKREARMQWRSALQPLVNQASELIYVGYLRKHMALPSTLKVFKHVFCSREQNKMGLDRAMDGAEFLHWYLRNSQRR